jgi:hypothetical protein
MSDIGLCNRSAGQVDADLLENVPHEGRTVKVAGGDCGRPESVGSPP